MAILQLITSLIKSLELYLTLKNKKFFLDMFETHQTRELKLIQDIEKMRSLGTNDSNDKADLLRNQLLSERNDWEKIQKLYENNTK